MDHPIHTDPLYTTARRIGVYQTLEYELAGDRLKSQRICALKLTEEILEYHTVRLQDGADLELTDVGVSPDDHRIAFSIDGRIGNIDDELMDVLSETTLRPVAITFEAAETDAE